MSRESATAKAETVTITVMTIEWVIKKELMIAAAIAVTIDFTGSVSWLFIPGVPSHDDEVLVI